MKGFRPVFGEPAGVLDDLLVVSDLHLGYEKVYQDSGVCIPSQMRDSIKRILELAERNSCSEILLLGDVKHNLPGISYENWSEIPVFFRLLLKRCRVSVVPGNHDGGLAGLLPSGVSVFEREYLKDDSVFAHGNKWISGKGRHLILGHSHPSYLFTDRLGAKSSEKVWLKGKINPDELSKRVGKTDISDFVVMPAFNPLIRGSPVNKAMPIGPFFRNRICTDAEAFMLDGSPLGKIPF